MIHDASTSYFIHMLMLEVKCDMRYATCNRPTIALDSLVLGPSAGLLVTDWLWEGPKHSTKLQKLPRTLEPVASTSRSGPFPLSITASRYAC